MASWMMSWECRREMRAEDRNMGISSLKMVFKAMGLDEITKGGGQSHAARRLTRRVTPCSKPSAGPYCPQDKVCPCSVTHTGPANFSGLIPFSPSLRSFLSIARSTLRSFTPPGFCWGSSPRLSVLLWAKDNSNSCSSKAFSNLPGRLLCTPPLCFWGLLDTLHYHCLSGSPLGEGVGAGPSCVSGASGPCPRLTESHPGLNTHPRVTQESEECLRAAAEEMGGGAEDVDFVPSFPP